MTELERKLKELGVLEQFEANLQRTSDALHELDGRSIINYAEFIRALYDVNPEAALGGAFKWDNTPEGPLFWRIVSELTTFDIEVLSPGLLHFCYSKYVSLN